MRCPVGQFLAPTTKSADAPLVESGLCDAIFEGLSTTYIEGGDYGEGKVITLPDGTRVNRYRWEFTLLGDDGQPLYEDRKDHPEFGNPIVVDSLTSTSMNAVSKTKPKTLRYLSALMSEAEYSAFLDSTGLDADVLRGRKVQVEIAIKDSGWPTVVNVLPARKPRGSAVRLTTEQDTRPEEMFRA
jgi:hypothetical protein